MSKSSPKTKTKLSVIVPEGREEIMSEKIRELAVEIMAATNPKDIGRHDFVVKKERGLVG